MLCSRFGCLERRVTRESSSDSNRQKQAQLCRPLTKSVHYTNDFALVTLNQDRPASSPFKTAALKHLETLPKQSRFQNKPPTIRQDSPRFTLRVHFTRVNLPVLEQLKNYPPTKCKSTQHPQRRPAHTRRIHWNAERPQDGTKFETVASKQVKS